MLRLRIAFLALCLGTAGFAVDGASGQDSGIPAGTAMPGTQIQLVGQRGNTTLAAARGSVATVIVFWSNRCPWGTKIEGRLSKYIQRYAQQGVVVLLVNSNDPAAFEKESAAENAATATRLGIPVLGDTTGKVADAFGATRNPAFYLFDGNHSLVYSGNFDDSPGDEAAVKNTFLDQATRVLLDDDGQPVQATKAFGCRITPVRG